MKMLLVHPGASWSTADVYDGLLGALQRQGVACVTYALDARIEAAGSWLNLLWKRRGKPDPRPSPVDVIYQAGQGILERALRHDVDLVLVVSGMYLHPDWMILLQRAGVPMALVLTESPYDDERQERVAHMAGAVWTHERASVERLRCVNPNTFYLPHAYNPAKHRPDVTGDPNVPAHDVVFVGTAFTERIETLSAVDWTGIDLGLYGTWTMLGSRSKLRQYVRGEEVANDYAAQLYRRAKIGLNLYRTSMGFGRHAAHITHAESLNPRALELAACGVFTISDARPEVREVFGENVPTFTTPDELERLIRRYLTDDAERQRLASSLPACVRNQTFDQRASQLLADLARVSARSHVLAAD